MSTDTAELVAYLCARYDEDERLARACGDETGWAREGENYSDGSGPVEQDEYPHYPWGSGEAELAYMKRTHPAEILADIASKRKILDEHGPETVWDGAGTEETVCTTCRYDDGTGTFPYGGCPTVRALAAPYADRPDFPEERKA